MIAHMIKRSTDDGSSEAHIVYCIEAIYSIVPYPSHVGGALDSVLMIQADPKGMFSTTIHLTLPEAEALANAILKTIQSCGRGGQHG